MVIPAESRPEVVASHLGPTHVPFNDPYSVESRYWHPDWRRGGWSPELLVEAARAADRVESPLKLTRFEQLTGIGRKVVARHFEGRWTELVERAGISVARKFWTDERLLEEFHRIASLLGRIPTMIEFEGFGRTTRQTLRMALGPKPAVLARYERWLVAEGRAFPAELPDGSLLPPACVVKGTWTRKRLIAAARKADRDAAEPLTLPGFCAAAEVSHYTIYRLFPGSWAELRRAAGIRSRPGARRHSDDRLLEYYGCIQGALGRPPTANELRRLAPVSHTTYRNRFGNMAELRQRYEQWSGAADNR